MLFAELAVGGAWAKHPFASGFVGDGLVGAIGRLEIALEKCGFVGAGPWDCDKSPAGDAPKGPPAPATVTPAAPEGGDAAREERRRRLENMTPEQREELRKRFENMTPEQREEFRKRRQQQREAQG